MNPVSQLISFGLRQVVGDAAEPITQAVENYFTDHGKALPDALARANDRAWQALAIALAGDGWLDQLTVFFASGDAKGVREQVRRFLEAKPVPFAGTPTEFRHACLTDLKKARKAGVLAADRLDIDAVARQAVDFRRYTDPEGLMDGARQAVASVGDALAADYPSLASLLRQPTLGGQPLLAAAFGYFFRREVETNDELARGLTFDGLRRLAAQQEVAFGEIGKALEELGGRFDELLGQVLERLDRIEAVVVETHGAVLDLHAEVQRLGGMYQGNAEEIRRLHQQVLAQLTRAGMQQGEVRPQHSFSIRNEDERQAVKLLLARFRQLPADQQQQAPALLNALGKLQIGAGDYAQARQTFGEVAVAVRDDAARAEACYNAYRAALEERRWDAALQAIRQAAELDPQRFEPFPLKRYDPVRILGAGGFGTAFLCRDHYFKDKEVVVKALHSADLVRSVEDVFGEAHALLQLNHPSIIGVLDCNYADAENLARPYIVMQYFPGGTLESFVRERGPLSPADLLAVAGQIVQGMKAAHERGVWHRDLKPANTLVLKQGDRWLVKVIDFGLALTKQAVETSMARLTGNATRPKRGRDGEVCCAGADGPGEGRTGEARAGGPILRCLLLRQAVLLRPVQDDRADGPPLGNEFAA